MMSCMVSAPGCRQPRARARASPLCRSSARQCGFSRAHAGRPRGLLLVRESRMTRQWSQPPDRLVALAATFPVSIGFFDLSPNYPMELFQTQCLWGFAQRVFERLFSPARADQLQRTRGPGLVLSRLPSISARCSRWPTRPTRSATR